MFSILTIHLFGILWFDCQPNACTIIIVQCNNKVDFSGTWSSRGLVFEQQGNGFQRSTESVNDLNFEVVLKLVSVQRPN